MKDFAYSAGSSPAILQDPPRDHLVGVKWIASRYSRYPANIWLTVLRQPTGSQPKPRLSLHRGQEIVTGGKRLHRYSDYRAALKARGLSEAGLEGYLAAFRYGMPPHGGFAIGLERLTARLLGLRNIREATLFPRDLQRLRP